MLLSRRDLGGGNYQYFNDENEISREEWLAAIAPYPIAGTGQRATPAFERITREISEKLADTMDPDNARAFVEEAIRLVWNARGAADIAAINERLATLTGWVTSEPYRQHLAEALRSLDR